MPEPRHSDGLCLRWRDLTRDVGLPERAFAVLFSVLRECQGRGKKQNVFPRREIYVLDRAPAARRSLSASWRRTPEPRSLRRRLWSGRRADASGRRRGSGGRRWSLRYSGRLSAAPIAEEARCQPRRPRRVQFRSAARRAGRAGLSAAGMIAGSAVGAGGGLRRRPGLSPQICLIRKFHNSTGRKFSPDFFRLPGTL